MENEIMNYEDTEIMDDVVVEEKSGIGTGAAMAIGAGLTLAICAGYKLVKNWIADQKAKKEQQKLDGEVPVESEDVAK